MKKLISLLLCLAMCFALMAGCGGETPDPSENNNPSGSTPAATDPAPSVPSDPIEKIKNSYYTYSFTEEGYGTFVYYVHFYDEVPVLGSVFYMGYVSNQILFAGTYEVIEEPIDYACYTKRGDAEMVTGTAPYTVIFYDWNGNEIERCGYDGDILYNDLETLAGMAHGPNYYFYETDVEGSEYAEYYKNEMNVEYMSFVAEDPTCTITLYHTGRYMDLMGMMIEGNWEVTSMDENGTAFKLVSDFDTDPIATLVVSPDGASAVYTAEGSDPVNLMSPAAAGPQTLFTMKGVQAIPGMEGVYGDLILTLLDDGTCSLIIDVYGNTMDIDAGTYSIGADGYTLTFNFNNAGEFVSALNESYAPTINYAVSGTAIGDIAAALSLVKE